MAEFRGLKFYFANFLQFLMAIMVKGHKYCHFFVIFVKDDAFYILIEFESDRMSPKGSKMEKLGFTG